jgi:hypothetical protein
VIIPSEESKDVAILSISDSGYIAPRGTIVNYPPILTSEVEYLNTVLISNTAPELILSNQHRESSGPRLDVQVRRIIPVAGYSLIQAVDIRRH